MSFGTPVFVVTHDRIEALALSDFILVLNEGRVCQSGPAHEVFTYPGNITVAHIVGVETVEPARVLRVVDGLATVQVGRAEIVALAREVREGAVYCCIRAEEVTLQKGAAASTSTRNQLPARIVSLTQEGALILVEFVKLCGARALFRHFATLPVIEIVTFLEKSDGHPE